MQRRDLLNDKRLRQLNEMVAAAVQRFRRFQQLVVYSQEGTSCLAALAASKLQRAGFSNILLSKGGKDARKKNGLLLVH